MTTAKVIQYQIKNYMVCICDEQRRILEKLVEAQFNVFSQCSPERSKGNSKGSQLARIGDCVAI
jgi:hypothetical protein